MLAAYHRPDAPSWATKWLGLKFEDGEHGRPRFDCRDLVRSVLLTEPRPVVEMDPFNDAGTWDAIKGAAKVTAALESNDWLPVDRSALRDFDVALMWVHHRIFGRETCKSLTHIGVVVAPDQLLHIERETLFSSCPPLSREDWRLHSFYRHRSLA